MVLLRGLGRLDLFPPNDASVARNLALLAGAERVDLDDVLTRLQPQQGMLYTTCCWPVEKRAANWCRPHHAGLSLLRFSGHHVRTTKVQ